MADYGWSFNRIIENGNNLAQFWQIDEVQQASKYLHRKIFAYKPAIFNKNTYKNDHTENTP
jgi:hypothetical protein